MSSKSRTLRSHQLRVSGAPPAPTFMARPCRCSETRSAPWTLMTMQARMLTIFLLETSVLDGILPPWSFGPLGTQGQGCTIHMDRPPVIDIDGASWWRDNTCHIHACQSASRLLLPKKYACIWLKNGIYCNWISYPVLIKWKKSALLGVFLSMVNLEQQFKIPKKWKFKFYLFHVKLHYFINLWSITQISKAWLYFCKSKVVVPNELVHIKLSQWWGVLASPIIAVTKSSLPYDKY